MSVKRNDLEFYDRSADRWWDETSLVYALNHLNQPRFEYFDRYLKNWQDIRVLDVGCGGGFSCEWMARRGAIVAGVDQSAACIQSAKSHALSHALTIEYQQGFAENLPYPDSSFDCVVCVDVLEHVAHLEQTIKEIFRVLKPGGIFFFDTVNRTFKSKLMMIWLLEDVLREIPRGIHDWNKFIKPEELAELMQTVGFHQIDFQGFNIFGETIWDNLLAYYRYKQTKHFSVSISSNRSLMYIGKAVKVNI